MNMTHRIMGKDGFNELHVQEDLENLCVTITIDDAEGEEKSISLDFDGLYRFVGEMLHVQQIIKRRGNLGYPEQRY